jgi:hypothetical protein
MPHEGLASAAIALPGTRNFSEAPHVQRAWRQCAAGSSLELADERSALRQDTLRLESSNFCLLGGNFGKVSDTGCRT